jgi:acetylornithine deacetylase/succinyl-diaminopimelate desuccinylase-like protein
MTPTTIRRVTGRGALRCILAAALTVGPSTILFAQATPAPGRAARPARDATSVSVVARARAILGEMVAANTASGSTTPLANALAARFRTAGFPAADVMVVGATAKNRNLVVRLRGTDRTRAPLLFLAHLDVVGAERAAWKTDPFVLTERNGYLYGRGVLDDKGPAAAYAAAFLDLKQRGIVPSRDLILALTAGEESGDDNGVQWLIANRPELVRAEYVINADAGGGDLQDGRRIAFLVQAAEKVYLDLTLSAKGPGGHSSVPAPPSPIDAVATAVARIARYEFPLSVNPVVRSYLERRAAISGGETGAAMAALARNPQDAIAARTLSSNPVSNALIRTTCVTTILSAGTAPNAIPSSASATVNCRIVAGEPADSVIAQIRRVIGDTLVRIDVAYPAVPSPPSALPPALERILSETVAGLWGALPIIPYMETGATDGLYLRNAGIPVFGLIGIFAPDDALASMHGNDERVPVAAYEDMVRFTTRLIERLAREP